MDGRTDEMFDEGKLCTILRESTAITHPLPHLLLSVIFETTTTTTTKTTTRYQMEI